MLNCELDVKKVLQDAEDWHKKNHSNGNIDKVKELLREETETIPYVTKIINTTTERVTPIPILHNKGLIYLQFCGWSINLHDDGTWCWEDTTGG